MVKDIARRSVYSLAAGLFVLSVIATNATRINKVHADTTYQGNVVDLAGDDAYSSSTIPLGFNFDFYGTTYTDAYVGTNGSFMFTDPDNSLGGSLPTNDFGAAILPFWDDLYNDAGNAKSMYYQTVGDPGSRQFIIQWTDMNFCCDTAAPFGSFQVILYEGTNKVRLQYFGLANTDQAKGDSATIGIQKDGTTANEFSDGSVALDAPSDAIEFTPDGDGGYTDNGHKVAYQPIVLTIDGLPAKPELNGPADGATDVNPDSVLLSWKSSSGADSYNVAYSTDPNVFDNNNDHVSNLSELIGSTLDSNTTYYWRVAAGNDKGYSYSDIHSFTVMDTSESIPDQPSSIGPTALTTGLTVDPTKLLSKPFTFNLSDDDSGQQVGYEFILTPTGNPEDAAIDYYSALGAQGARSFAFGHQNGGAYLKGSNSTHLVDGQTYTVLVRAYDAQGAGSGFTDGSENFVYTATPADDGDNTTAGTEDAAPNSGDANDDGQPDAWENNVSSFVDPVSTHYAALQVDGLNPGDCSNQSVTVDSETSLAAQDPAYAYPGGLMNFTVHCVTPGGSAKITEYFYGSYPGTYGVRKYNPTTHTYTDIPGAQIGLTTIAGQPVIKAVYFVTDGGPLDQDGTVNGTIVDPSGFGVQTGVGAPNTGLQRVSLAPSVAAITLGGGLLLARRSRKF